MIGFSITLVEIKNACVQPSHPRLSQLTPMAMSAIFNSNHSNLSLGIDHMDFSNRVMGEAYHSYLTGYNNTTEGLENHFAPSPISTFWCEQNIFSNRSGQTGLNFKVLTSIKA
jgi:hypothetical protein